MDVSEGVGGVGAGGPRAQGFGSASWRSDELLDKFIFNFQAQLC